MIRTRLRLVLAVGSLAGPALTQGALDFDAPLFAGGSERKVGALALVDLDADGILDAVVGHTSHFAGDPVDELFVLPGLGDGTFGAPGPNLPIGGEAVALAVADVNADGHPDVVVASDHWPSGDELVVLHGAGDGSLTIAEQLDCEFARAVAVADLDGDGRLDLVGRTVDAARAYLALPGGGYGAPIDSAFAGLVQLVVRDVTGDGVPDVVGSGKDFADFLLAVLPGLGDGSFGAPVALSTAGDPLWHSVCVGDFDGDGVVDIAARLTSITVGVALGLGGGLFGPLDPWELPTQMSNEQLACADMDGDGRDDLVAVARLVDGGLDEPLAAVRLHRPGGGFDVEVSRVRMRHDQRFALGDLDGDGDCDLLHGLEVDVAVALNRGDGRLRTAERLPLPGRPEQTALADLDGDGDLDLVAATWLGPVTSGANVFLNDGWGLQPTAVLYTTAPGDFPELLELVDLDGDGALDLVMSLIDGGAVTALGTGAGGFATPTSAGLAGDVSGFAIGLLDGDAHPDVVFARPDPGDVQVWRGLGDGSLALAGTHALAGDLGDVALRDLEGDDALDLIASVGTGDLALLPGDGAGGFGAATILDGGPGLQMQGFVVDDLDADGAQDVVVFHDTAAWVHLGHGDGSFAPRFSQQTGGGIAGSMTSADVDGDGARDLVLLDALGLRVLPGHGDGTFAAPLRWTTAYGGSSHPPSLGDLDGDGSLDVAYGDLQGLAFTGFGSGATVLLNRTGPARDLGQGLGGTLGRPVLGVRGTCLPGTPLVIALESALPASTAWLVLGAARIDAPFKGGALVPSPDLLVPGLPVGGDGGLELPSTWPGGIPSGVQVYVQEWVVDAGAPVGLAGSGAVELTVP